MILKVAIRSEFRVEFVFSSSSSAYNEEAGVGRVIVRVNTSGGRVSLMLVLVFTHFVLLVKSVQVVVCPVWSWSSVNVLVEVRSRGCVVSC